MCSGSFVGSEHIACETYNTRKGELIFISSAQDTSLCASTHRLQHESAPFRDNKNSHVFTAIFEEKKRACLSIDKVRTSQVHSSSSPHQSPTLQSPSLLCAQRGPTNMRLHRRACSHARHHEIRLRAAHVSVTYLPRKSSPFCSPPPTASCCTKHQRAARVPFGAHCQLCYITNLLRTLAIRNRRQLRNVHSCIHIVRVMAPTPRMAARTPCARVHPPCQQPPRVVSPVDNRVRASNDQPLTLALALFLFPKLLTLAS
eukprot:TRINITY_DN40714_c0_g1_i1.p1 TRINITY_DN40714_c0_g1~~TRINITY_DN40714_c0_g1_i1.p1  ORF type:complete len:258 (-),score=20.23 TRINITY_DN40714_c0_g1_i1:587-1360(-)